ncbi:MAG: HD domain-containing protein [Nitrospirae bacterium]|nr:HD domain-containing protein [Nitrospirota bacterium]
MENIKTDPLIEQKLLLSEQESVIVLERISKIKDASMGNHSLRTGHYARLIAENIGMSKEDQDIIFHAAQIHDIGNVCISDKILFKPGKLTDEEFKIVKSHTIEGYQFLKDRENRYLKAAAIIALTHHERLDGSGYPHGLLSPDIPVWGKIMAVVDVFDALTSKGPYREPWTINDAAAVLAKNKGILFATEFVDIFILHLDKINEIRLNLSDSQL